MGLQNRDGQFEVQTLSIIGPYDVQRFAQFSPEDSANFYVQQGKNTKRPFSMYPTLGRSHINYLGFNQLVFGSEPRGLFKTIKYAYIVVGNSIYRVDSQYNTINIAMDQNGQPLQTIAGKIQFSYLVVNSIVFACFVDDQKIYIYREDTELFYVVTDPNAPGNSTVDGKLTKPGYIATFGNRITVSVNNSSQFFLSQVNLGGNAFDPATCFTIAGAAVFATEDGIIRQMGVLNNTLYIFTDYITGVWSNNAAVFSGTNAYFPWKKNSTYNWNFGIASSGSLDIDFGYMAFLAQNSDGLLQFMYSNGGQPEKISSEAIDVMLQNYTNTFGTNNPFTGTNVNGFLYQYENTIFYRISGGPYHDAGILDQELDNNSIEYKFDTQTWHRCIELNGERCRVQLHLYFNTKHLVSLTGDTTVYNMSGQFYYNETRNPAQSNPQAPDAYNVYPLRYERITPIISAPDYSEFETEYVEIDFVFGDSNINFSSAPFQNVRFMVTEGSTPGNLTYIVSESSTLENPIYVVTGDSNVPTLADNTYNYLFNPTIELYWSDDGGISFQSADVREFSQMGVYQWRMRWYQLGPSRNRAYKLVCVSHVPIVVLGAVMNVRRISGGAN